MWTNDLPFDEIARLFDREPAQVKSAYDEWLGRKRKRRGPVRPDTRLLAALSGLSQGSISNFVQDKPGSLSEANRRRLSKLVELVGYVPSRAAQNRAYLAAISIPRKTCSGRAVAADCMNSPLPLPTSTSKGASRPNNATTSQGLGSWSNVFR